LLLLRRRLLSTGDVGAWTEKSRWAAQPQALLTALAHHCRPSL
jgi:hypothetical protein